MIETANYLSKDLFSTRHVPYTVSRDLVATRAVSIPPWQNGNAESHSLILHSPQDVRDFTHIHMRSRMAQAGLTYVKYNFSNEEEICIELINLSTQQIDLAQGIGILSLYRPSPPARGADLIHSVLTHIETDYDDIIFADQEGNIMEIGSNELQGSTEALTYLGVRVNTDILMEIDANKKISEIVGSTDVRHEATSRLRPVKNATMNPFGVSTTIPISVNGTYLTLVDDLYGDLIHLPSLVIEPNRSQWLTNNDPNSGIRLEFNSRQQRTITKASLPPYVFFTVHPQD